MDHSVWAFGLGCLVLALLILATAAWCSWTATRLDRLHLRCETARAALRVHLMQRSAVAVELAGSGLSDPASALLLLDAAHTAREAEAADGPDHPRQPHPRGGAPHTPWLAESGLTQALHALELPDAQTEPLVSELQEAARRAAMARRISNDLAATTLALRERRRVRWFRLAGRAPPPEMIDFDDRVPS
jgi:hypothetical protein